MAERRYGLYLESGPKMRKTMVHVLDLLGCTVNGPTTDEALQATPDGIRRYAGFLADHGEGIDPRAAFRTRVVEHITEGQWLGNGDPSIMFGPDAKTPAPTEIKRSAERWRWIRADTLSMVDGLSDRQLRAKPKPTGRPIQGILEHVLEPSRGYMRNVLGDMPGIDEVVMRWRKGALPVRDALAAGVEPTVERLTTMTPEERSREVPHGAALWTARKMLRRLLEHEWEHREELRRRLSPQAS
jgi:uncharacterized damage-inducible protein DinB/predicted RNase H-like HicB family nuclease